MVICGTRHDDFLLREEKGEIATRLIFDLSVPRNVDPKLALTPNLLLWNIDQLTALMQPVLFGIDEVKKQLETKVDRYVASFEGKRVFAHHRIFLS